MRKPKTDDLSRTVAWALDLADAGHLFVSYENLLADLTRLLSAGGETRAADLELGAHGRAGYQGCVSNDGLLQE